MESNYTLSTPISTTTIISTTISTTTSNMTNNSYSYQDTSSDSGLAASYIALIITLIGLFSTLIVHYNIKRVKICCLKIECNKKKIQMIQNHLNLNYLITRISIAMISILYI